MNRFEVLTAEEVVKRELDPNSIWVWDHDTDFYGYLYDSKENTIVFTDGGEPEDMTLRRNLGYLVYLLNKVANTYPYDDGDVKVLGPEIFASEDESAISWKGKNYVPQNDG